MSNERTRAQNLAARAEMFSAWPYAHWPGAPGMRSRPKSAVDGSQQLMFVPSPESNPIPGSWPGELPGDRADLYARIKNSQDYWSAGDVWFAMNNPSHARTNNQEQEPKPPSPNSTYDEYFEYASKLAPALNQLLFGKDPEERAAILRSKITNFEALRDSQSNNAIRMLLTSQIDKYKAQLEAVEKQAAESIATRQASLALKFMAIGGAGVGLVVLLQLSNYIRKKTKQI